MRAGCEDGDDAVDEGAGVPAWAFAPREVGEVDADVGCGEQRERRRPGCGPSVAVPMHGGLTNPAGGGHDYRESGGSRVERGMAAEGVRAKTARGRGRTVRQWARWSWARWRIVLWRLYAATFIRPSFIGGSVIPPSSWMCAIGGWGWRGAGCRRGGESGARLR